MNIFAIALHYNNTTSNSFDHAQNILDKFNPGARQLISAGKAYLKALHGRLTLLDNGSNICSQKRLTITDLSLHLCAHITGTSAASRVFNEALAKIAVNAQQGGTNDIGRESYIETYWNNCVGTLIESNFVRFAGSALMNIVGVYKDIQDQHMNIVSL